MQTSVATIKGNEEVEIEGEEDNNREEADEEEKVEISLHALRGLSNSKIIKVEGRALDSRLMILIDSGSTHNFLDDGISKNLRRSLIGTHLLSVTVANGQKVLCKLARMGFYW